MSDGKDIDLNARLTLTAEEAGRVLGVNHATLRRHHGAMGIPTIRLGNRLLFPVPELREWIAANARVEAPAKGAAA